MCCSTRSPTDAKAPKSIRYHFSSLCFGSCPSSLSISAPSRLFVLCCAMLCRAQVIQDHYAMLTEYVECQTCKNHRSHPEPCLDIPLVVKGGTPSLPVAHLFSPLRSTLLFVALFFDRYQEFDRFDQSVFARGAVRRREYGHLSALRLQTTVAAWYLAPSLRSPANPTFSPSFLSSLCVQAQSSVLCLRSCRFS